MISTSQPVLTHVFRVEVFAKADDQFQVAVEKTCCTKASLRLIEDAPGHVFAELTLSGTVGRSLGRRFWRCFARSVDGSSPVMEFRLNAEIVPAVEIRLPSPPPGQAPLGRPLEIAGKLIWRSSHPVMKAGEWPVPLVASNLAALSFAWRPEVSTAPNVNGWMESERGFTIQLSNLKQGFASLALKSPEDV
ncbi:MAG: hypothetical protein ACRC1K_09585, partial [Planctomycetia bacterium]